MTLSIAVLDRGHVRLVDWMGNDLSIVRAARVSYNAEWRAGEDEGKDRKLIRYLLKNRHTSPFESVVFTFDIKAPIFVVRQWHRHRTWSYNEVSARYAELSEEFYIPTTENVGKQSKDNKQAREVLRPSEVREKAMLITSFQDTLRESSMAAFARYRYWLGEGIPRELARCFLPVNTYTHFFGTVNLHNLFHFLELRLHPHAQWEIQQYAQAILSLIGDVVPVSVEEWIALRSEAS